MKQQLEVEFQPTGRRSPITSGDTLLKAARQAGVGLNALCGGTRSCGSCRVIVPIASNVSALTSVEEKVLSQAEIRQGVRLACQTNVMNSCSVEIPPESMTQSQRTQVEGSRVFFSGEPVVTTAGVNINPTEATKTTPVWERFTTQLAVEIPDIETVCDLDMIRNISEISKKNDGILKVGIENRHVRRISGLHDPFYGVAIDIGTTKIAGYLLDLETGVVVAQQGIMNPQITFGEDIMARISFAMSQKNGALLLQSKLIEALNSLIDSLCSRAINEKSLVDLGLRHVRDQIIELVVVGNTAMHHFFLGLPVDQLGVAPYLPIVVSPLDLNSGDVGLNLVPNTHVHVLPNIAGFVGADHVSMLLAAMQETPADNTLFIDIGTNTELSLFCNGELTACSTASGPAFEGAHIQDGMRAGDGAIEKVRFNSQEQFDYLTVGGTPPSGICGSGIIDIIAELLNTGLLNQRGMLLNESKLIRDGRHGRELLLVTADKTMHNQDIVLTRKDIAEIQLAKGAIRAGIELTLKENNIGVNDVTDVFVAGAFGSYLNIKNAVTIGLFPDFKQATYKQIGNAAGTGARMALLSAEKRRSAAEIAKDANYLELAAHTEFAAEFTKAMMFK